MRLSDKQHDAAVMGMLLSKAVATMTYPARRHKCAECSTVYECHLCTLEEEHHLHSGSRLPFVCEDCIESKDIKTVFILRDFDYGWNEYDHITGKRLNVYRISQRTTRSHFMYSFKKKRKK